MHEAVLDRHASLRSGTLVVAAAVAAFRARAERTDAIDHERRQLRTGSLTAATKETRDAMEVQAMRLVRAVSLYARVAGDHALLRVFDVAPSDFTHATEADAVTLASRVLGAADGHDATSTDYGAMKKDLDALRAAVAAVTSAAATRDATCGQREARTASLSGTFSDAQRALRVLDDLVPGVVGDDTLAAE